MPGRRAGSPIAVYAETPKQDSKRFKSIANTIHFSYLPICYLCLSLMQELRTAYEPCRGVRSLYVINAGFEPGRLTADQWAPQILNLFFHQYSIRQCFQTVSTFWWTSKRNYLLYFVIIIFNNNVFLIIWKRRCRFAWEEQVFLTIFFIFLIPLIFHYLLSSLGLHQTLLLKQGGK